MTAPSIKARPLVLPDHEGGPAPRLRYTPLPGLAVDDYIDDYAQHLGQTGVFDYLSTNGSGVDVDDVRKLDLSALGVLGGAFTRMLSTDGGVKKMRLAEMVVDHCKRFRVQAWDADAEDWISLDSREAIDAHLDVGDHLALVRALGGEALRPLWSRLSSRAEERPNGSAKPLPANEPTS